MAYAPVQQLTADEIRKIAKARIGFKIHAAAYVTVNLFFAAIWLVTNLSGAVDDQAWYYWPIWPHMAWGIGLAIHAFVVYGAGVDWEHREEERIRRQLAREPRTREPPAPPARPQ